MNHGLPVRTKNENSELLQNLKWRTGLIPNHESRRTSFKATTARILDSLGFRIKMKCCARSLVASAFGDGTACQFSWYPTFHGYEHHGQQAKM